MGASTEPRRAIDWPPASAPTPPPELMVGTSTILWVLEGRIVLLASPAGPVFLAVQRPGPTLLKENRLVRGWLPSIGRQRRVNLPGFATLAGVAAAIGITMTAAVLLPGTLSWRVVGPPVLRDEQGRRVDLLSAARLLPAAPTEVGSPTVERVKLEYGRLRGDVAYRIENSALFDPTVATTARFETALTLWQDAPASDAERARLAAMVRVTFETARAHAETVGLGHLPDEARGQAKRAASAARLAASATTPAERANAERQVARILSALGLEHLTDPARPALQQGPP